MGFSRQEEAGGDRHWAGRGKITVDAGAVDEYLRVTGATELDRSMFVASTAVKPPDAKRFHDLENEPLPRAERDHKGKTSKRKQTKAARKK